MNRTAECIAELNKQTERAGRAKELTRDLVQEARVLCEISRQLRAETRALMRYRPAGWGWRAAAKFLSDHTRCTGAHGEGEAGCGHTRYRQPPG